MRSIYCLSLDLTLKNTNIYFFVTISEYFTEKKNIYHWLDFNER